jgi:tRNA (guanine-N7-)-methyltransferase
MRCHINEPPGSPPLKAQLEIAGKDGYFARRMILGCAEPHELFPDWQRDFGRAAPLELEIGPGRGAFALDQAARHPEVDLVLIETRRSDCELIRARASKRGLHNLMVFHGDARLLVPRFFPPGALAAVHLQFPDPWWKKRHHKRRMVDADFALQVCGLLAPGGLVDFRTDVPAYAREGEQTWLEAGLEKLPDEPPEVLSTRERRYAVAGRPVFRSRFRRPAGEVRAVQSGRTGREWRDVRRK